MGWRNDSNWWPRPSRWFIALLFVGSALALFLLICGGPPWEI